MGLDESIENLIQAGNYATQSINRLEAQMNHLIKDRDEKTLPNTFSTIRECPSILIGMKNHGILKTLTKIQSHHTNLNLTNHNPLTNWQVLILMRLNLIVTVNPISNFVI